MKNKGICKVRIHRSFLIVVLLALPAISLSDQAQYFYDETGRLVGVVDGQGNMAVYNYDRVGNLLSIERFAASGSGSNQIGIFLLTPSSALIGTTVQIRGFGFSATASDNQVSFNGRPASVVSSTTATVTAIVPASATSGPVTVTNSNGTASSAQAFTVLVPPIIAGVEPARLPQGTATRLIISGFNLITANDVVFSQSGFSAAVLPGATAQTLPINLTVAATVPAGSYAFSVVSPLGTVQSGTILVTVTPAVPSFSVMNRLSVFFPFASQVSPTGVRASVARPLSVFLPTSEPVPAMTVAPPLSVSMP